MTPISRGARSNRLLTASAAWDRFWVACIAVAPAVFHELTSFTAEIKPYLVTTLDDGERLVLVEAAWAQDDSRDPLRDSWQANPLDEDLPCFEIYGRPAGIERLRALAIAVGKWQRRHELVRPDNLPNLHCMERALEMIQHPFVFPEPVPRAPQLILEQMNARFPRSTALPFRFEAAGLWDGESEDHCRRRLKRAFADTLNLHLLLARRAAAQSGIPVRRNLEHLIWFAHWQLLGWNAARIHAELAPSGTNEVKRRTPGGVVFVRGYPHIHNALTRAAALLNLRRRRGRPGR